MKKSGLLLSAIFFLFMVSCGGNQQAQEEKASCGKEKKCCQKEKKCDKSDERSEECKAFAERWEKFEDLALEEKQELIAKRKAFVEKEREEMKARIAECEAKWEKFEEWTIEEQKEFLDKLPCKKGKKCCEKKCEKKAESCAVKEESKSCAK